jgi:hypothetical protein
VSFAIPNNTWSRSRRACDISRWHTRGKCWFDRLTQVIDKRSTTVTFVGVTCHITLSRLPAAPPHVVFDRPWKSTGDRSSARSHSQTSIVQEKLREARRQPQGRIRIKKHLTSMTPILSPPNERRYRRSPYSNRRKVTAHRHSSSRVSRLVCPGGLAVV